MISPNDIRIRRTNYEPLYNTTVFIATIERRQSFAISNFLVDDIGKAKAQQLVLQQMFKGIHSDVYGGLERNIAMIYAKYRGYSHLIPEMAEMFEEIKALLESMRYESWIKLMEPRNDLIEETRL